MDNDCYAFRLVLSIYSFSNDYELQYDHEIRNDFASRIDTRGLVYVK